MGWLKRFMGFEAPKPAAGSQAQGNLPFGLGSGRMLKLDPSLKLLLDGHSELEVPEQEVVWAVGEVDLGQSVRLARFYMEDEDYWLQVVMSGTSAEDVRDIILFGYYSVLPINSDAELKRLVGPESTIGLPYYEHEGYEFVRQWGSEEGQTELTPISERVTSPETSYRIQHLSMLYARETGLTDRREFLLLSVEEDEEGNVSLTTSVGVTLQSTDFNVI
ncbi:hypothetical protein DA83_21080 [Pseudomonas sp. 250J]|uniref:DUF2491 family protein n=1 Tax=Pseudomonas peradeniyensis TaxID=2745488 RepID=A0A923G899_9PSED|nr:MULTISPECIES: DUF2491 family protein [unclassified Pseudomonas]MBV4503772.1 YjfK family protein [Pseudomonas peradeniyensis]KNX78731.1 hypothetical protein DA83_21080 [Pseudomonas sp. 250J]MCU7237191.1 YjfK family protein [Pseudomonas peradeniyensis]MCU7280669.1 YjfK family protein [Pseudomonas peradeniyensis]QZA52918.1 YjfK family protein [Pseudomonas sp. 2hn]